MILFSQNNKDYLNDSNNDNRKKYFKVSNLTIERLVTHFYMLSERIVCRVVQILFSHLWLEIY